MSGVDYDRDEDALTHNVIMQTLADLGDHDREKGVPKDELVLEVDDRTEVPVGDIETALHDIHMGGNVYETAPGRYKRTYPDQTEAIMTDGGSDRVDGELLDRIQELMLDHQGPSNTISSGQIAEVLGVDDADAQPKTREAIRVLSEEREVPIASTSQGYYLIQTQDHLNDYLENLDGRIAGIQKRKQTAIDAWESHIEAAARKRGESDD